MGAKKERKHVDMADMDRKKEISGGQERNHLHKLTSNGAWLSAVLHRLNRTELTQKEFRDNICLRYGLMPQDIPAICDCCGNRFSIEHVLSFPKGGLVLERHDDASKKWGVLGSWDLIPSDITYKMKINSMTVQRERIRSKARQGGGTSQGGVDIIGEAQGGGGSGRTLNGTSVLVRRTGQV